MNQETQVKWQGRWNQVKGYAKKTWGELTDDDLAVAEGDFDTLVGKIQERTGETAEAILGRFESAFDDDDASTGNGFL
jgi:uncharacterized protein YjbJ (UPF0337 family)